VIYLVLWNYSRERQSVTHCTQRAGLLVGVLRSACAAFLQRGTVFGEP
jgi:hypothetical protein